MQTTILSCVLVVLITLGGVVGPVAGVQTDQSADGQVQLRNSDGEIYQSGTVQNSSGSIEAGGNVTVTGNVSTEIPDAEDNVIYALVGTKSGDIYGVERMDSLGSGTVTVDASVPETTSNETVIWTIVAVTSEDRAREVFRNGAAKDRYDTERLRAVLDSINESESGGDGQNTRSIELTVKTTRGMNLTGGDGSFSTPFAVTDGQNVNVTVAWRGVPAGERIQVTDVDDPGDDTGLDVFTNFTVQRESGSRTVTINSARLQELGPKDTDIPSFVRIEFGARWVDNGETQLRQDTARAIELIDETTVYFSDVPSSVADGEQTTVSFYGWSPESNVDVVLETESGDVVGTASEIPVSNSSQPAFSGAISFTPGKFTDPGNELGITVRDQASGPISSVKSVTVTDSGGVSNETEPQVQLENEDDQFYQSGEITSRSGNITPGEALTVTGEVRPLIEDARDNVVYAVVGTKSGDIYGIEQMDSLGSGTVTVDAQIPDTASNETVIWTITAVLSEDRAREVFRNSAANDRYDTERLRVVLGSIEGEDDTGGSNSTVSQVFETDFDYDVSPTERGWIQIEEEDNRLLADNSRVHAEGPRDERFNALGATFTHPINLSTEGAFSVTYENVTNTEEFYGLQLFLSTATRPEDASTRNSSGYNVRVRKTGQDANDIWLSRVTDNGTEILRNFTSAQNGDPHDITIRRTATDAPVELLLDGAVVATLPEETFTSQSEEGFSRFNHLTLQFAGFDQFVDGIVLESAAQEPLENTTDSGSENPLSATRTLSSSTIQPGGSVTVTLEGTAQGDAFTFNEQFNPSVNGATFQSASVEGSPVSPTLGSADADGAVVTVSDLQVGDTVTATYTVSVADDVTTPNTIDISGTATSGDQTDVALSVDTLTVAEGSPLDPPVAQYDTDTDGEITIVELGGAASDYASGEISIAELGQVASVYASS